jgi:hypothetical protein
MPDPTVPSDEDDIHTWEKDSANDWVPHKVNVAITDFGEGLWVKTVIVCPPLI